MTEKYPRELDRIVAYNTKDVVEDLKWKSLQEVDWDERINLNGINFKGIETNILAGVIPAKKIDPADI